MRQAITVFAIAAALTLAGSVVHAQFQAGQSINVGQGWQYYGIDFGTLHVPVGPAVLAYHAPTGTWYVAALAHPQRHGLQGSEPGPGICYESDGSRWPANAQISIGDVGSIPTPWSLAQHGEPDGLDDITITDPATGQMTIVYGQGFLACDTADIG